MSEWVVVGISGVTCGGKTTLADRLRDSLTPVRVFHQDRYFHPDDSPHHVRVEGMQHNNYDVLSALDMDRMYTDVVDALGGSDGEGGGLRFLVLEGFTVLNHRPLGDLCHLKYYLVLEYGECYRRRALRVYEPPDVPGYFERCVWPEHLRYRAELVSRSDVTVLDATAPDNLHTILADLRARGAKDHH